MTQIRKIGPYTGKALEILAEVEATLVQRGEEHNEGFVHDGVDGVMYSMLRKFRRTWMKVMNRKAPSREDIVDLVGWSILLQSLIELNPEALEEMKVISDVPFPLSSRIDP